MVLNNHYDSLIFPPHDLLSDEPPLESYRHLKQLISLLTSLERSWSDRADFFVGGNMTIYYSIHQHKSKKIRGPDLFVVLDTDRRERKSWIVWEEDGKYPNFILEIVSEATTTIDRELKKRLYQDIFRTPDYFWFDPFQLEFKGFKHTYRCYEPIQPNEHGWLWSEELKLYLGIKNQQLRFFDFHGALILTPEEAEADAQERAETEQKRAETEQKRAETEQKRAETLQQQAKIQQKRADEAEKQLAAERERADQAEAKLEIERLRVERLHRFAKYIQ